MRLLRANCYDHAVQSRTFAADIYLLLAALIWGTGFVAQRLVVDHAGPLTFNGVRLTLGGLVLLPLAWRERHTLHSGASARQAWLGSLTLGAIMMAGSAVQQLGLMHTTAGKAGFITGLYVVLVPFLGLGLRQKIGVPAWWGAALATIGLYFLSVTAAWTVERGDFWVLVGTFFWAAQIHLLNWTLGRAGACWVACVQGITSGCLSLICAFIWETPSQSTLTQVIWPTLYSGIMSAGVAFTFQALGQRHAPPSHAAILLSLEAVFAALSGWIMLDERLTARGWLGCLLMLAGTLISQIPTERPKAQTNPLDPPPPRSA